MRVAIAATKKPPAYLREARMRAGFVSRGTASTVVPYSPETIGRHERGDVEMEPEDALVYAECYQSPDILPRYCATCPVGRAIGRTATDRPLALDFLRKLEESINDIILIGLGKEKAAPGATGSGQARK